MVESPFPLHCHLLPPCPPRHDCPIRASRIFKLSDVRRDLSFSGYKEKASAETETAQTARESVERRDVKKQEAELSLAQRRRTRAGLVRLASRNVVLISLFLY